MSEHDRFGYAEWWPIPEGMAADAAFVARLVADTAPDVQGRALREAMRRWGDLPTHTGPVSHTVGSVTDEDGTRRCVVRFDCIVTR